MTCWSTLASFKHFAEINVDDVFSRQLKRKCQFSPFRPVLGESRKYSISSKVCFIGFYYRKGKAKKIRKILQQDS